MKYGLTEKSIGFFTPSPLVESREDKIARLEREAVERNAYIRKMEIENGIGALVSYDSWLAGPWS
jgi:hypothetical protein